MKHEQVTVNYWTMVKSSFTYLALILAGWVLLKLIMAIFWFPSYLQKRNKRTEADNDVAARLEPEELKKDN